MKNYNHIELFAGCGGLTLGLEKAGFSLTMANELSPMAAETFAYNFFGENLEELANLKKPSKRVMWLTSNFDKKNLKSRLRENPFLYPIMGEGTNVVYSEVTDNFNDLNGNLIVGSIVELNKIINSPDNESKLAKLLRTGFNSPRGEVDLVSGGPPCQSFSMAGMRRKDCEKNILPFEFAKFVNVVRPRVVLLENVTGILRAFTQDGKKFHAWFEVAKVFASFGYVPLCLHINARMVGVPQNRPRFIMIALRMDIYEQYTSTFIEGSADDIIFRPSLVFAEKVRKDIDSVKLSDIKYFDAMHEKDFELLSSSDVLAPLVSIPYGKAVSVKDAIDDLKEYNASVSSNFVKNINEMFQGILSRPKKELELQNHNFRTNSVLVKCRFRIYQILQQIEVKLGHKEVTKAVLTIMKNDNETQLEETLWSELKEFVFMDKGGFPRSFNDKNDFIVYLSDFKTKKQTQKALNAMEPAPATLSIPDDACHYDTDELRVLTVREMARIQSFPDDFIFRSKITTGGQMRKFEVPQYTQVGNAVPPLLGMTLGKVIKNILNSVDKIAGFK
ncbi:DNA (cytosine-5-)-methyltransferase [Yersinia intermedia]|uniref:DNA cytosine methyltransferase n=1 Tax=Yersinia intermedia TaxID=631 RepID=UPI00223FB2A4|nr:DNA (cytosine-5-)-methyltransferase [Yersinia intermedia]UZM70590.1 DNA (cytosine-5-)-methyltransferase [Yersinia intermedia]